MLTTSAIVHECGMVCCTINDHSSATAAVQQNVMLSLGAYSCLSFDAYFAVGPSETMQKVRCDSFSTPPVTSACTHSCSCTCPSLFKTTGVSVLDLIELHVALSSFHRSARANTLLATKVVMAPPLEASFKANKLKRAFLIHLPRKEERSNLSKDSLGFFFDRAQSTRLSPKFWFLLDLSMNVSALGATSNLSLPLMGRGCGATGSVGGSGCKVVGLCVGWGLGKPGSVGAVG